MMPGSILKRTEAEAHASQTVLADGFAKILQQHHPSNLLLYTLAWQLPPEQSAGSTPTIHGSSLALLFFSH